MNRRLLVVLSLAVVILVVASVYAYPIFPDSSSDSGDARIEVQPVNEDVDRPVVAFENLTSEQQDVFERAVSDPRNAASIPNSTDDDFWYDQPIVRYENTTYRVLVTEHQQ